MDHQQFIEVVRSYIKELDINQIYQQAVQTYYNRFADKTQKVNTIQAKIDVDEIYVDKVMELVRRNMIQDGYKNNKQFKDGIISARVSLISNFWRLNNDNFFSPKRRKT